MSIAIVAAAVLAFLAHEPLLVVIGLRGSQARRDRGKLAVRHLSTLVTGAASISGYAACVGSTVTRGAILLSVVLASGVLIAVFRRQERTAIGEIVAAIALASAGVPAMTAGGASIGAALRVWMVWSVASVVTILAIRSIVAREEKQRARRVAGALSIVVFVLGVILACSRVPGAGVAWGILPACALGLALSWLAPRPQELRRVGWIAVGASAVTAVILAATSV